LNTEKNFTYFRPVVLKLDGIVHLGAILRSKGRKKQRGL